MMKWPAYAVLGCSLLGGVCAFGEEKARNPELEAIEEVIRTIDSIFEESQVGATTKAPKPKKKKWSFAFPKDRLDKPKAAPQSKPKLKPVSQGQSDLLAYFEDRLAIGARISTYALQDDSAESFIGTINQLDADPDLVSRPFLDYKVTPWASLELSYEKIVATTITTSGKSDGDVEMTGPTLTALFRWQNGTAITPFAGFGVGFMNGDFSEAADWALGYESPEEYAAAGSPSTPLNGRVRRMDVDDDTALIFTGGIHWAFSENWMLDLFFRYMDLEADAVFIGTVNGQLQTEKPGTFPLEHMGYGAGIRYNF